MPVATGVAAQRQVVLLAVLATAFALILYFRLIARLGGQKASTVTFLIPVFAVAWGAVFLGETVTLPMALGGAIVLAGTALTLGLRLWRGKPLRTTPESYNARLFRKNCTQTRVGWSAQGFDALRPSDNIPGCVKPS